MLYCFTTNIDLWIEILVTGPFLDLPTFSGFISENFYAGPRRCGGAIASPFLLSLNPISIWGSCPTSLCFHPIWIQFGDQDLGRVRPLQRLLPRICCFISSLPTDFSNLRALTRCQFILLNTCENYPQKKVLGNVFLFGHYF